MTPDQIIALMQTGQLNAAYREAQAATHAHPQSAKAWLLLARIEARQEKYAQAAGHLKQARALPQWKKLKLTVPVKPRSVIDAATQHDPQAALGMVADGLLAHPSNAQLLYLGALAHARLGQTAKARVMLGQAQIASPGLNFAEPHRLAALRQALQGTAQSVQSSAPSKSVQAAVSSSGARPSTASKNSSASKNHSLDGVTLHTTISNSMLGSGPPLGFPPLWVMVGGGGMVLLNILGAVAARQGKRQQADQTADLQAWATDQQKLMDLFIQEQEAKSFGQSDPSAAARIAESYALSQWLWQAVSAGHAPAALKAEFYRRMTLLRGGTPSPLLPGPAAQGFGGTATPRRPMFPAPPVVVQQGGPIIINHTSPVVVGTPPVESSFRDTAPDTFSSSSDADTSSFTSDSSSSFSDSGSSTDSDSSGGGNNW